MDALHTEQSAFNNMDYCHTFYGIFKDIVTNKHNNILNNNVILLPPSCVFIPLFCLYIYFPVYK